MDPPVLTVNFGSNRADTRTCSSESSYTHIIGPGGEQSRASPNHVDVGGIGGPDVTPVVQSQ